MNENIKKAMAIQKKNEKVVLNHFPTMTNDSGIYIFYRKDESGLKFAYIGQAKHMLTRVAQHLSGYQHIDLSLKKRGFKTEENPNGWSCLVVYIGQDLLDKYEQEFIKEYGNAGWQLLNKTAGGQGEGKTQIAEYKPSRTYRDGVVQGRKALAKELSHIIDKHLTIELKEAKKGNKTSQKALEKFMSLLNEGA
jgi:hypothetical protein